MPASPPLEPPFVDEASDRRVRLQSAILLTLGLGLFLALPFVLSIGSVVFLPPVTAMIFTIVLSPLADRMTRLGLPNTLASLFAILALIAVVVLALLLILQPAFVMVDQVPALARQVAMRFAELRGNLSWISDVNRQLAKITGRTAREVVVATPSVIEQLAFATPSVILEMLLTLLMTFFMIESRIRMKRRILFDRHSFSASVRLARVLRDVQERVGSYILTVALVNFVIGLIVAAGAWAFGLTAPVMWGGLAFVLNFLPYIGPLVMMGLLGLVGLGTSSSVALGLVPMLAYIGLHATESNVITPSILGARFTLNPVAILISISYFSWIWGVLGALLSVPILLTVSALLEHIGRPNLVGFLFGEALFQPGRLAGMDEDDPEETPQPG
ncbi:putative PurR-regulated permease PerM [Novosphingobium hassiacum]|uniref:Putative PurR-regulated permease PerM n=1 Tax=Novosphingobium hassiacum TaxID=173676 RepID=A0A7W6A0C0_9SPHN|nr:AI-2E family transporter [Novosphingobium hassiacum]MBB3862242.1 putative PurR-regulated permease PerM [Novosphingobium hassiacum]